MNKLETIEALRNAARQYVIADRALGMVCAPNGVDPIGCTVFAMKGLYANQIPVESFSAAQWLQEVTRLHEVLVKTFSMDNDDVRAIWFPILNA